MKKLFLLLFPLLLVACNDDEMTVPMQLPPITSEGANTFGCLVNGEAWTPKGFIFPESNFDVYYDEVYYNYLFIQMHNWDDNLPVSQAITINVYRLDNGQDTVNSVIFRGFEECVNNSNGYKNIIEKIFH